MLKNSGYAYIKSTLRIPTNVSNMPVQMKKKNNVLPAIFDSHKKKTQLKGFIYQYVD